MAYIGAEPVPGQNREIDDISSGFNGSATAFTLQVSSTNVSPESANNILVNLGGVMQNPGTDYTIAASTITFTTAPASGLSFWALILGAGINTATVADATIGSAKLIDTAVTAGSYTTADITVDAKGRITAAASGSISNAEIANNAVTTAKIADSTGASDGVTTAKLATDAVTAAKLASNSVVSDSIVDGSIVNADVNASAAIAGTKISPDFGSQNIVTTGSISGAAGTFTSDLDISSDIRHIGDTNTKIRFPAADTVSVETAGSERTRIDNSGHLLVGTSSGRENIFNGTNTHSPLLQVEGANNNHARGLLNVYNFNGGAGPYLALCKSRSNSVGGQTIINDDDEIGMISFQGSDGTNFVDAGRIACESDGTPGADDMPGRIDIKTTADAATTPTTRMRFKANGDIEVQNYGTFFGNTGLKIYGSLSGGPEMDISRDGGKAMLLNRNGSDGTILELRRGWGAGGSITVATNSATYNTSSDYRLKENIVAISDGITRLKTLKPSRFNWIGDTDSTRDGFIAHEVTAVPEAITGTKDEVYSEDDSSINVKTGDPKYQGIDQAKLVPLLTAALQEAITKIETLETKVAALEAA